MQIQVGGLFKLLGTWKEIAYADNLFDGTGQQWNTGRSDMVSSTLSDTSTTITWDVTFYPKGVANDLEPNNGVQVLTVFEQG